MPSVVAIMSASNSNLYDVIKGAIHRIKIDNKRFLQTVTVEKEIGVCRVVVAGKTYINMSSNDYLGLRHHPYLSEKAIQYTDVYGASSSASRLITGTLEIHRALEEGLARFKGVEKTLLFSCGFQANSAILSALCNKMWMRCAPEVFTDKLNHASMHEGLRNVRQNRYKHLDMQHFETMLSRCDSPYKLAATESIFSMDGDALNVQKWSAICRKNGVLSFLDEAHSEGVEGEDGKGLGCNVAVDVIVGTFGKAWGSFGAYVSTDSVIHQFLVNFCRGFIYTTALPPAVIGATQAALELMPKLDRRRRRLKQLSMHVRKKLKTYGYTITGATHIISVIIGGDREAVRAAETFKAAGMWLSPIRPPTVPKGLSRLRISLSALHADGDIEKMLAIFKQLRSKKM